MKFTRVRKKSCLATNHTLIELETAIKVLRYRVMVAAKLRNLKEVVV
jgi:hypothetical protein